MANLEQTQQEWVEQYADKMTSRWKNWHRPNQIDQACKQRLTAQLAQYFAEPIKRDFIQRTY